MTQPSPDAGPMEPPEWPPPNVIAELVREATLAPSMHNTQPWRFRADAASQTIELYADPSRMLRYSDRNGRAVHIACGAALLNLRLAVALAGRQPIVRLFPDAGQPLLLAAFGWRARTVLARPTGSCTRPSQPGTPTGGRSATGPCRRACSPHWPTRRGEPAHPAAGDRRRLAGP